MKSRSCNTIVTSNMSLGLPAIFEFPGVIVNFQESSRVEAGVLKMVRRIRPDWSKEDIILQRFTMPDSINQSLLYGGYTTSKGEMVLIKVYNPSEVSSKKLSDEATTMRLLAFHYLGPRLFATFSNGFAFDFVPGVPLDFYLATEKNIYSLVATKIGEMHRHLSEYLGIKGVSKPVHSKLFENLRACLIKIPNKLPDTKCNLRMKQELPNKLGLLSELDELESRLIYSPVSPYGDGAKISKGFLNSEPPRVVFCHGNLSPSNIYYDALRRNIAFLHPEFSGPNYQSFEIAQHFLTLCGPDLNKIGRQEFVPAKEFQRRWCQHYLAAFRNVELFQVTLSDVEQLYVEIQRFSLVFCLQEIIWSLCNLDTSPNTTTADILQYGIQRFQQYRKSKYNILSMAI